jgi:hypothetical protein
MAGARRAARSGLALATVAAIAACTSAPSASPGSTTGPTSTPGAVASESPTQGPLETTAATVAPTLPVSSGPWQPVAPQDAVAGSQVQDVVWTGTQFIAASSGLGGSGTFLRSSDGKTWKSGTSGGTSGSPERIAVGPNGIVAIGTLDEKTASWASADGIHWNYHLKVFPTALGTNDMVRVTDVVATSTGWLAVGRDDESCFVSCMPAPLRALVWSSSDGLTWTRVTGQGALGGGGINAIAAVDGGFVAGGDADGRAAFWWSPDGLAWTRVADDPSFGPATSGDVVQVMGIAARDGVVVAVGMSAAGGDSPPTVVAWHSADGRTWTAASVENGTEGQVFSVAATPTGFLATGPSGDTSCLGGIWSSTDGSAWTCDATDPAFEGFGPYAAAGSPSMEIAAGLTSFGCGEDDCPNGFPGAIWWRPIP